MSNPPATPSRLSKSALFSLIFGILGWCIPFVGAILAVILGIMGFIVGGKPGFRGRWMAVVGVILAVLSIAFWSTAGIGILAAWKAGSGFASALAAPGHGARDFIRAVDSGDEATAKDLSVMNDVDYTAAKKVIKAQGGFVDSTFNEVNITNDEAHVAGTGDFKTGTRKITADVIHVSDKWKVKSLTIAP